MIDTTRPLTRQIDRRITIKAIGNTIIQLRDNTRLIAINILISNMHRVDASFTIRGQSKIGVGVFETHSHIDYNNSLFAILSL